MTGRRLLVLSLVCALAAVSSRAHAECVETAPSGADRPQLLDTFPSRGLSGYAATLHVVVTHGQGETVLPHGLGLQRESDSARDMKSAGFELPDAMAGAGPQLSRLPVDPQTGRRQTTVDLPLLALPSGPGRHVLTLPPLPIAIARASGDLVTLCTRSHVLVVDDPTASTPDAKPQPNPSPRPQREEWVALKRALGWAAIGSVVGSALAWAIYLWLKRPRPVPPPPPPRVPWEVALERLYEVRHAGLLETSRFSEFFDRVNDAVREYLGARYGFDGLESTTDETLTALTRLPHFSLPMPELAGFLQQCDLVKFADVTPTLEECQHALSEAERVVRFTTPLVRDDVVSAAAQVRS
jgi:hypothetical protein